MPHLAYSILQNKLLKLLVFAKICSLLYSQENLNRLKAHFFIKFLDSNLFFFNKLKMLFCFCDI
jgi:hypothetical protein